MRGKNMTKRRLAAVKQMLTASQPSNVDSPTNRGTRPDTTHCYGDVDERFLLHLNYRPHVFIFSSTGGDMAYMAACLDFLKIAKDIVMVGTGQVMSAAVPLLCAGAERYVTRNTRLMLHPPYVSGASEMNGVQLEAEKRELSLGQHLLLKTLAAGSKKSLKFWRSFASYEHYFDCREALKLGLVDGVL
jgi:ATP-dependent protease ClpP protease subunit